MSYVVPAFFRGKAWQGFTLGICAVVMAIAFSIFSWNGYRLWQLHGAEPRLRQVSGAVERNEVQPRDRSGSVAFITVVTVPGAAEPLRVYGAQPVAPGEEVRVLVDPEGVFSSRILYARETAADSLRASMRLGLAYLALLAGIFLAAGWVAKRAFRNIRR